MSFREPKYSLLLGCEHMSSFDTRADLNRRHLYFKFFVFLVGGMNMGGLQQFSSPNTNTLNTSLLGSFGGQGFNGNSGRGMYLFRCSSGRFYSC